MRSLWPYIPLCLFCLLANFCTLKKPSFYPVNKTSQRIQLDGKADEAAWAGAVWLQDFSDPWHDEAAPLTHFRALWDDDNFYFIFRADDDEIICPKEDNEEMNAVNSDRVEIFFKIDDRMDPYYSLEMDALGRVFDSRGIYPRRIDHTWDWPEKELELSTTIDATGYWLEGRISINSLRQLGLIQPDGKIKAGLFRGDYRKGTADKVSIRWISWIKPDSEKPDFHIPSAFGELKLMPLHP